MSPPCSVFKKGGRAAVRSLPTCLAAPFCDHSCRSGLPRELGMAQAEAEEGEGRRWDMLQSAHGMSSPRLLKAVSTADL